MEPIEGSRVWRPAGFDLGKMPRTGEVKVPSQAVLLGYKLPTPRSATEQCSRMSSAAQVTEKRNGETVAALPACHTKLLVFLLTNE